MSQTSVSISIYAPIEKVFAAISDIESFPNRAEAINEVEFLTEQRSGIGTRFRETRILNGRQSQTELEVTEFVVNDRIRMVSDQGGTIWDTIFVVNQTGAETQLDMTMDGSKE